MLSAPQCLREYRFAVLLPAGEAFPEAQGDAAREPVILQGAVDLAFVEDGKLVIVDYKTDKVKEPSVLAPMYSQQLMLYKDALTECLGMTVKECLIYSIRHGAEVRVF